MADAARPFARYEAEGIGAVPVHAITAGTTMRRLELALVACMVAVSPMNYFRAGFAYITICDVFAVLSFLVLLLNGRVPIRPMGGVSKAWYLLVLVFMTGLMLGAIVNGDTVAGAVMLAQYCFTLILMPILILQRPRREIVLLIKMWVGGMILIMLHGAYAYTFTPDDTRFVTPSGRLASLVERENAAGALTAMAITFTLWLAYMREIPAWIVAVLVMPLAYGLLLTGSNTGFLLTGIGTLVLAVSSGSARIIGGIAIGGALGVAVILQWGTLFLPQIFLDRVFGALSSGDFSQAGTFDDRMFLIHEAIGVANGTLGIGLGPDQYRLFSEHEAPVHNTYLLVLAEGGLMSLTAHVGLFLASIIIAWPAILDRRTRLSGALTVTVVIMFAAAQNGLAHFYARFWIVPWMLALSVSLYGVTPHPRSR